MKCHFFKLRVQNTSFQSLWLHSIRAWREYISHSPVPIHFLSFTMIQWNLLFTGQDSRLLHIGRPRIEWEAKAYKTKIAYCNQSVQQFTRVNWTRIGNTLYVWIIQSKVLCVILLYHLLREITQWVLCQIILFEETLLKSLLTAGEEADLSFATQSSKENHYAKFTQSNIITYIWGHAKCVVCVYSVGSNSVSIIIRTFHLCGEIWSPISGFGNSFKRERTSTREVFVCDRTRPNGICLKL